MRLYPLLLLPLPVICQFASGEPLPFNPDYPAEVGRRYEQAAATARVKICEMSREQQKEIVKSSAAFYMLQNVTPQQAENMELSELIQALKAEPRPLLANTPSLAVCVIPLKRADDLLRLESVESKSFSTNYNFSLYTKNDPQQYTPPTALALVFLEFGPFAGHTQGFSVSANFGIEPNPPAGYYAENSFSSGTGRSFDATPEIFRAAAPAPNYFRSSEIDIIFFKSTRAKFPMNVDETCKALGLDSDRCKAASPGYSKEEGSTLTLLLSPPREYPSIHLVFYLDRESNPEKPVKAAGIILYEEHGGRYRRY